MRKERKPLVYVEDIISELTQYPDNMIYKYEIRRLVEKVSKEKGVFISTSVSEVDWEADGDIYD